MIQTDKMKGISLEIKAWIATKGWQSLIHKKLSLLFLVVIYKIALNNKPVFFFIVTKGHVEKLLSSSLTQWVEEKVKVWWGLREEGGEGGGGGLMGDWRSSFHSWTSQPRKTCHRFSPSGWFTFVLIWESLSMLTFYSWTSLPRKGVSSSLCNFILLGGFGQTQWHFAFCTSPLTFIPVCQKSINISQFYQNLIKCPSSKI